MLDVSTTDRYCALPSAPSGTSQKVTFPYVQAQFMPETVELNVPPSVHSGGYTR